MATFDFFRNVRSTGVICTRTLFEGAVQAPALRLLLQQIVAEKDPDKRGELKKRLPVVTWQAHFPHGRRKNADAQPSGLFMVDIDHVDNPKGLYEERIKPLIASPQPSPKGKGFKSPLLQEGAGEASLPILAVHLTPSTKGLRIVAVCDPALDIAGNQQRVADVLGVEIDSVCKDLARSSFLVSKEYFYYLDPSLWEDIKEFRSYNSSGVTDNTPTSGTQQTEHSSELPATPELPTRAQPTPLHHGRGRGWVFSPPSGGVGGGFGGGLFGHPLRPHHTPLVGDSLRGAGAGEVEPQHADV